MSMTTRFMGLGLLSMLSASLVVVAACSDGDETTSATPDSGISGADGAVAPPLPPSACADAGAPQRSCTAKACSAQLGEPAVCVEGQCVKLKTEECIEVFGDYENDDAIVLGSMFALRGADVSTGLARTRSIELAVKEINKTSGGVYTGDGCGRRPLVLVECDDSASPRDPTDAGAGKYDPLKAAAHLAKELKVPAIIGPSSSNNTVNVATKVTLEAKTLIFTPSGGAAEITTIPGATVDGVRMVWRTVPSDELQAKALVKVGEEVLADIKAKTAKATLKVAIVNRDDAFGRGLRDAVKAALHLNGVSYSDAANAANVLEKSYPIDALAAAGVYPTIVDDLEAHQPDVIFYFGFGEIFKNVIGAYEDRATANSLTKPFWLSSNSGQRAELLTTILPAAGTPRPDLRNRVRGTSSLVLTPLAQDFFNFRFKAEYPDSKELVFGMPQAYDATYLVAYALSSTKPTLTTAISSMDVARALPSTTGGATRIDVGPVKLKEGLELARSGTKFDFNGAAGPQDFDPATGEAPGDYSVWCVRLDPNTQAPIYENATGQTWSYASDQLQGTFACP